MDKSTKKILDTLSQIGFGLTVKYKYHKSYDEHKKYFDGRLVALEWFGDTLFYYQQKEKHLVRELEHTIKEKKKDLSILKDGDYKRGIFDTFSEMEQELQRNKNKPIEDNFMDR
jgi:hypothetical protein